VNQLVEVHRRIKVCVVVFLHDYRPQMNRSQSAFAASASTEEPSYDMPIMTRSVSENVHASSSGDCSYVILVIRYNNYSNRLTAFCLGLPG